jgi:hypothetical protein
VVHDEISNVAVHVNLIHRSLELDERCHASSSRFFLADYQLLESVTHGLFALTVQLLVRPAASRHDLVSIRECLEKGTNILLDFSVDLAS